MSSATPISFAQLRLTPTPESTSVEQQTAITALLSRRQTAPQLSREMDARTTGRQ